MASHNNESYLPRLPEELIIRFFCSAESFFDALHLAATLHLHTSNLAQQCEYNLQQYQPTVDPMPSLCPGPPGLSDWDTTDFTCGS